MKMTIDVKRVKNKKFWYLQMKNLCMVYDMVYVPVGIHLVYKSHEKINIKVQVYKGICEYLGIRAVYEQKAA